MPSDEFADPGFELEAVVSARRTPSTTTYGVNGSVCVVPKTGASIAAVFPSAIRTPPGHEPFSPPDGYGGTRSVRA